MKWLVVILCVAMVSAVGLVVGLRATADDSSGPKRACVKTNSCLSILAPNDK
jgi:hypothetical protein